MSVEGLVAAVYVPFLPATGPALLSVTTVYDRRCQTLRFPRSHSAVTGTDIATNFRPSFPKHPRFPWLCHEIATNLAGMPRLAATGNANRTNPNEIRQNLYRPRHNHCVL